MRHGEYHQCPACTNGREGAKVFRCRNCQARFCEDCCTGGLLSRRCPSCGHEKATGLGNGWQGIGTIQPPPPVRVRAVAVRYRRT